MQQVELLEQRDYQTDIPAKVAEKLRQTMRALIVMATGLGKTITCGLTVQEYFKHVNSFRVLYLCDRTIALDQAEKEFLEKLEIKVKPARFYASNQARGGGAWRPFNCLCFFPKIKQCKRMV